MRDFFHHNTRGVVHGESADTSAQCGKRERTDLQFLGPSETAVCRAADEVGAGLEILPHRGCMDDISARQPPCPRDDGLPCLQRALGDGVPLDLGSASPFDGPGDTAAHPEVRVGSVDDGVDCEGGDIAAIDPKDARTYPMFDRCPSQEPTLGPEPCYVKSVRRLSCRPGPRPSHPRPPADVRSWRRCQSCSRHQSGETSLDFVYLRTAGRVPARSLATRARNSSYSRRSVRTFSVFHAVSSTCSPSCRMSCTRGSMTRLLRIFPIILIASRFTSMSSSLSAATSRSSAESPCNA